MTMTISETEKSGTPAGDGGARWLWGPDAEPDPRFDPDGVAKEQVLRWAIRHGLTLYQGLPGNKFPRKYHCDPDCGYQCPDGCGRRHQHHWCDPCPEQEPGSKCRCFRVSKGDGLILVKVPSWMVAIDEDGTEAAPVVAGLALPDHFAIQSRRSGGIKRFFYREGGVRRAIRPLGAEIPLDIIGNPDSRLVWLKLWDDAGYDIISRSQMMPDCPESVLELLASPGKDTAVPGKHHGAAAGLNGSGDLPPTAQLVAEGIPHGLQEDWLYRVADREARTQWLQRREFDEDRITATLAAIARASEQDDRDPWLVSQLRGKAASAIAFIRSETEAETVTEAAADSAADDAVTDSHLAGRFAAEVLLGRYCWVTGSGWLAWRGDRWSRLGKDDRSVVELAREWVLARYQAFLGEADPKEIASGSKAWLQQLSKQHVRAVAELAEGIVQHDPSEFDAHPDLLNCANGVADLRTGELLPHDPALMLTRSTGTRYVPGAAHPDWDKALTALPEDVRAWYQVRVGQGATGYMPPDDAVLINQGGGENGKTTILQGISHALGDYYVQVPPQALYGDTSQHSTTMMTFRGARIAALEETPEEGRLNMQQVKQMTTPQLTARYVYRDFTTFDVTHSAIVNTNHELLVESTDHGSWRRLSLVRWPYTYLKPGQEKKLPSHRDGDPGLRDRIIAGKQGQHEAALAWMAEGARRWYEAGRVFPPLPGRVEADTEAWRSRANLVWGFCQEHLEPDTGQHVIADELYEFFNSVLRDSGHRAWSKTLFFSRLGENAAAMGWDIEKKKTRRREDRLSRSPAAWQPAKDSYQAWHGIRFRREPSWQDEPDSQDVEAAEAGPSPVPDVPGRKQLPGSPESCDRLVTQKSYFRVGTSGTPVNKQVSDSGEAGGSKAVPDVPGLEEVSPIRARRESYFRPGTPGTPEIEPEPLPANPAETAGVQAGTSQGAGWPAGWGAALAAARAPQEGSQP